MRKLFLFATVAAAGLFASCSSTDDAISDAGNSGVENVDGDRTAIKIGIGTPGQSDTRGTGTVGGVGTDNAALGYLANSWYGQRINVFMFKQGTLEYATEKVDGVDTKLYENRLMITPGTTENLISPALQTNPLDGGEAMNADASIKYYPNTGNYDFFGYHGDDAVAADAGLAPKKYDAQGAITATEADVVKWTVPFTIDGSQDLMSTKAILTHIEDDPSTTTVNESESGQDYIMSQAPAARQNDYYSAYAARRGVQPTLTFNHLLSRLSFVVIPGNKEASGYGERFVISEYTIRTISSEEWNALGTTDQGLFAQDAQDATKYNPQTATVPAATFDAYSDAVKAFGTPSDYENGFNPDRAVYVDSIRVKSMNKGELVVAWKPDQEVVATAPATGTYMPAYKKITWDADQLGDVSKWKWLSLKERAAYKKNEGAEVTAADTDLGTTADLEASKTAKQGELTTLNTDLTGLNSDLTNLNTELGQLQAELQTLQQADPQDAAAISAKEGEITAKEGEITAKEGEITLKEAAITAKEAEIAEIDVKLANYAKELAILTAQTISASSYARLTDGAGGGKSKYTALSDVEKMNADMVALTPTRPVAQDGPSYTSWTATETQLGEALIVAPNIYDADGNVTPAPLTMEVFLSQEVPTNWNWPYIYEKKTMSYPLTLAPAGNAAFEINKSYNVKLTVYGFSRIDVQVVVNDWKAGGEIGIGQD